MKCSALFSFPCCPRGWRSTGLPGSGPQPPWTPVSFRGLGLGNQKQESLELPRFLVSNQFPGDQNEREPHSSTMHLVTSCKSRTFSAPLLLRCRRGKLGMWCSGVPPPPASHCPCLPKTSSLSLLCPPPPSSLALLSSFLPEVHAASSPLVQFLPSLCSLLLSCYFASLSFPLFPLPFLPAPCLSFSVSPFFL